MKSNPHSRQKYNDSIHQYKNATSKFITRQKRDSPSSQTGHQAIAMCQHLNHFVELIQNSLITNLVHEKTPIGYIITHDES